MKMLRCTIPCLLTGMFFLLFNTTANAGGGTLQKLDEGICKDQVTGLMWQIAKSKRFSDIGDVDKYVAAQKLGGYTDWRLPTTLEGSDLRGIIAIQGNEDCNISRLESAYWQVDKKKGTIAAKLELECFCRGDFDLIPKDKGSVRLVRSATTTN